jgi:hypothetical protein
MNTVCRLSCGSVLCLPRVACDVMVVLCWGMCYLGVVLWLCCVVCCGCVVDVLWLCFWGKGLKCCSCDEGVMWLCCVRVTFRKLCLCCCFVLLCWCCVLLW